MAVNGSVPLVRDDAEAGEIVTEVTAGPCGGAAVTVTVAEANLVASALLVAVTVAVPTVAGAVYAPDDVMLPDEAFQVTDLSVAEPCTAALNCSTPPSTNEEETGEIATEVTAGPDGEGLGLDVDVTVTGTDADLLASAALVAVTTPVPAVDGAV